MMVNLNILNFISTLVCMIKIVLFWCIIVSACIKNASGSFKTNMEVKLLT